MLSRVDMSLYVGTAGPGVRRAGHADPRHKMHKEAGWFITYMQAGLPVLARINRGNDLAALIKVERVGEAYVGDSVDAFYEAAISVCDAADRELMVQRATALSDRLYSSRAAVEQIVGSVGALN